MRTGDLSDVLIWIRDKHGILVENLVYHLQSWGLSCGEETHGELLESVENFKQLQTDLRDKLELNPISRDLYPDLPWRTSGTGELAVLPADVHASCLMLKIMENVYTETELEDHCGHPHNAGWMNVFQRWSQSNMLRRYWPLLRNEYGRNFVAFCQRELALKAEIKRLVCRFTADRWRCSNLRRCKTTNETAAAALAPTWFCK